MSALSTPSIDMSVESPASSRAVSPSLEARSRMLRERVHELAGSILTEGGTVTPMSPRTAAGVIQRTPEEVNLDVAMAIAKGLVATNNKRNLEYRKDTDEYRRQIWRLDQKIAYLEHDICIGECPLDVPPKFPTPVPPEGYVINEGDYPSLVVPAGNGTFKQAKWIKQLDDGCVAMLGPTAVQSDEPIITDIYCTPSYAGLVPFQPMPTWFCQLLTGPGPLYHTLREAAADLNDWGIMAEVIRFRYLDDRIGGLYAELDRLQGDLDACKYERGLVQS
jgi:hypothetical protein